MTSPLDYIALNDGSDAEVSDGDGSLQSQSQNHTNVSHNTDIVDGTINDTVSSASFGNFDFSNTATAHRWPELDKTPIMKFYRIAMKRGDTKKYYIGVSKHNLATPETVMKLFADKLDIKKDAQRLVVSYPLRKQDVVLNPINV